MGKKVLILGVASVQMDAILELKKMGYETHACAMAIDGPGANAADYFSIINIVDQDQIINYIKENDISLVYSVGSDIAMPIASTISEKLNLPYFVTADTARVCNNKNLMRQKLGKDFKGNVNFQVISNVNERLELNFPFIIKPADSQGQRGVNLVESYNDYYEYFDFAKQYSRSGYVIAEQYISGPELSVNGYLVDGELKYLIASDRDTWPQFTGLIHKHIVPTNNINEEVTEELRGIIKSACIKLGINNGPVYAQMKLEESKPYIIEITPRLDGCHMWKVLRHYSGVNLLKLIFEHLLNNNTMELNNFKSNQRNNYILEFICQKPETKADYTNYKAVLSESIESFKYYNNNDMIRRINGKYEKIGYVIYTI